MSLGGKSLSQKIVLVLKYNLVNHHKPLVLRRV